MAKLKKSTRTAKKSAAPADLQAKAEQLSRSLADSAQQVWLAGIGAFQRAQQEGSKLFDALVKEGASFEAVTRKLATGRVDAVRDAASTLLDVSLTTCLPRRPMLVPLVVAHSAPRATFTRGWEACAESSNSPACAIGTRARGGRLDV